MKQKDLVAGEIYINAAGQKLRYISVSYYPIACMETQYEFRLITPSGCELSQHFHAEELKELQPLEKEEKMTDRPFVVGEIYQRKIKVCLKFLSYEERNGLVVAIFWDGCLEQTIWYYQDIWHTIKPIPKEETIERVLQYDDVRIFFGSQQEMLPPKFRRDYNHKTLVRITHIDGVIKKIEVIGE
jgi:hypothetical protein